MEKNVSKPDTKNNTHFNHCGYCVTYICSSESQNTNSSYLPLLHVGHGNHDGHLHPD